MLHTDASLQRSFPPKFSVQSYLASGAWWYCKHPESISHLPSHSLEQKSLLQIIISIQLPPTPLLNSPDIIWYLSTPIPSHTKRTTQRQPNQTRRRKKEEKQRGKNRQDSHKTNLSLSLPIYIHKNVSLVVYVICFACASFCLPLLFPSLLPKNPPPYKFLPESTTHLYSS